MTSKTLVKKINKLIYIEEEPFETLDIVEVAMNNDNNDFRKMKKKLSKQEEYNITSYENQHASAKQKCQRKPNIASTRQYEGIHRK